MTSKRYERINTSDTIQKMNRKKEKYTPYNGKEAPEEQPP